MYKIKKILSNKKIIISIILFIIYLLIFFINHKTIWAADDYAFYNNIWGNGHQFSFEKIFEKTMSFYLSWTGRFVSTYVNYSILFFSKNIFNIINSFVFTSLIYLIYKICKKSKEEKPSLLILSFILIWFFMPQLGEVAFWQIGSVIYLWTFVSVLSIILLFVNLLKRQDNIKNNFIIIILLFILGLIAGNGFETNSIMLVVFTFLSILYVKFIQKNKLPLWAIFTFIGSFIGFCSNFFSPGNSARISTMGANSSLLETLTLGTGGVFFRGILQTNIYILLITVLFLYFIYLLSVNKNRLKFFNTNLIIIPFLLLIVSSFILIICIKFNGVSITQFLDWFYPNYKLFDFFIAGFAFLILILIIFSFLFRKKLFENTDKIVNTIYLLFILSSVVGISSYIFTSLAWPRSYMGMSGFLIIAICFIINNISINFKNKKIYQNIALSIIVIMFLFSYYFVIIEIAQSKNWFVKTHIQINQEIANGNTYILVPTYLSTNKYNAASVEKWVIPVVVKDTDYVTEDGVNKDYEWINIAITNYYFKSSSAWSEGKRIIGY